MDKHINLLELKNEVLYSIKELIRYNDIGFVFNNIESVIFLPVPFKNGNTKDKLYEKNKEISLRLIRSAQKTYKHFVTELSLRKETFDYIRETNPCFCKNMEDRVSEDDYTTYTKLLKKCSTDINKLIITLFNDREGNYEDLLLKNKDFVSEIIDTESNSKLSYIEDKFVLKELNIINYSNMPNNIIHNINILKRDIKQRIDIYDNLKEQYSFDQEER